jgi:hypothetical protein
MKTHDLLRGIIASLTVAAAQAGPIANGGFDNNPGTPSFIGPWQANGAVTPVRDGSAFVSGPFSLRVTGRTVATDGVQQTTGVLAGLVNGASYVTRFRIKSDGPAQVRCFIYITSSIAQTPILLAEKVVRSSEAGQWVFIEGSQQVAWTGTASSARFYFSVEQLFQSTVPAGAYPSFNLDEVTMELDDDRDGLSNTEELAGGTSQSNPDTDGDKMSDKWELAHGLNPNDPTDAGADPDHDGFTNLVEYWANTDPQDAASYPGIPSDPLASDATRALIYQLQTRAARSTGRRLTGQHAQNIASPNDYTTYVAGLNSAMTAAGFPSWVAVLGIAAEGPSSEQPLQITTSAPVGRAYMDAGGLLVLHWTPRNPWTNGHNSDHTGVDIANLITPGTVANTRMTGWMDTVAAELALFGPDRPVIFRPLSEMNGAWNWYGRLTQDDFITLYRWLRNYFVTSKGLHNIVWTLESHLGVHRSSGILNTGASMDYYWPGDDAIDLIGFSTYVHDWVPTFDADAISRLHPKAFAITEGGPPSNEDDAPNGYNSLYLDALDTYYPRAAFFIIWNGFPGAANMAIKDNPNYVGLLTDTRVTNRESLLWRAPSALTAGAASSTQFSLGWTGSAGATGYSLESSANGFAPWLSAGSSATTGATAGGFAPFTTRHFRVRAVFPGGDSAPLSVASATTWSLFLQWKNDILGDMNADNLADVDTDGLATVLEYSLGANPFTNSTAQRPVQGTVNVAGVNYLTLTFRRRTGANGANGVTIIVEATGDLLAGAWQPDPVQFGTPVNNGDGTETVTFRDIIPLGSVPLRMMRLRVTAP